MSQENGIDTGGTYNIAQSVFKLSMLANGANGIKDTSADDLVTVLAQKIDYSFRNEASALGDWQRVWGPAVFEKDQSGTVDNALYVAYNAANKLYVVAVAATNATSKYDIYTLDLNVGATTAFPAGVVPVGCDAPAGAPAGNISRGTALGITNLLQMVDKPVPGSPGLQAFLKSVMAPDATLVFTGHSLGSALAPALAFWLFPDPATSGWAAIRVLPTAGATPGDAGFKAGFAAAFPGIRIAGVDKGYGFWNTLIWNEYDVVPHAWANISGVEPPAAANDIIWGSLSRQSLYGEMTLAAEAEIVPLITGLKALPGRNAYARLPDRMFRSAYMPGTISSRKQFEDIALDQHIQAYGSFFGVPVSGELAAGIGVSLIAPADIGQAAAPELADAD